MKIPDVRNARPVGKKTTAPINAQTGWLVCGKMMTYRRRKAIASTKPASTKSSHMITRSYVGLAARADPGSKVSS